MKEMSKEAATSASSSSSTGSKADHDHDQDQDLENNAGTFGEKVPQLKKTHFLLRLLYGTKPAPIVQNEKIYPELKANWFSKLFFTWIYPVQKIGYLRRLEDEDLYQLEDGLTTEWMTTEFQKNLAIRAKQYYDKYGEDSRYTKYTLLRALNDTFKTSYWRGGVAKVFSDACQVLIALPVRHLVRNIQMKEGSNDEHALGKAAGYAVAIAVMLILGSVLLSHFFYYSMLNGGRVKNVLTNTIYEKSFRLSSKSRLKYPNGKINSMVMADLSRIELAVACFHFIWVFPITFSVALIILLVNIRAPALVGLGLIAVFLLWLFYIAKKLKDLRRRSTVFIDKRVRAINEIINSLRMIKFYSWENAYFQNVSLFRKQEKKIILKQQMIKSTQNSGVSSITILATMLTFVTMVSINSGFEASNIFSSLTLFNSLRFPLNLLPLSVGFAVDAALAFERISDFLQAEEGEDTVERFPKEDSENSIVIENGEFQWDVTEDENNSKHELAEGENDLSFPGLKNINLEIKRNEFIIVTGSIGTGKTSLLNAIDGSMKKIKGNSKLYGSLTFCSYPWVQNATIRDNILFGLPYDREKYCTIVKACALDVDFHMLPDGDQTEVGERGITLSGGQKARINLARAVYSDRDIILLDDVLSAVDARVGKHIMNECICGVLKNKTRVLATHQLSLIGSADRIIVLDGKGSIDIGNYNELMERNQSFITLMEFNKQQEEEGEEGEPTKEEIEKQEEEEIALEHQKSQLSKIQSKKEVEKKTGNSVEGRSQNSISLKIYYKYFSLAAGPLKGFIFPIFFCIAAVNGFLQLFHSVWLSFWLQHKFDISEGTYKGLYIMFAFLATGSYVLLFASIAFINNKSGLKLFVLSTRNFLRTPMWFMDVTPIGRILNRFTKDVDVLDTDLVEQLRLFINSIILVTSTLILCACYIPWFLLCLPVIFFIYYHLFVFYKNSSLDIKRMESVNRSFVFSQFNETLAGMKIIKSYGSKERFVKQFKTFSDNMNQALFLSYANQRWLGIRLDCTSACVSFFVSMLCAGGVFKISGASSGLLVAYVIQVSSLTSLLLRSMTQLENDMNSVERLFEYATELPQEGPFEISETKPSPDWPFSGAIKFDKVDLAYRPGLPLVLKSVSFDVKAHEKIGICGRTGAGKSTIMNALFRISELSGGQVLIDDVDISKIGLNDLRSKLSIIPQDPVLFHGTIRQNLDPFNTSSDAELWDALRRSWLVDEGAQGLEEYNPDVVNLKSLHKFHLDQNVEDDGANFSLGERQLLALARALVRNSKILILDEATSSVDYETDSKIQSTISKEFAHCTILCIAHRLKTILNYDRILVLDKGEVMEFDTPWNLFKMGGIFTEMCERSDITEANFEGLNKN